LDIGFRHAGLDWKEWVEINTNLIRPVEVGLLVGDSSKARKMLGWEVNVTFEKLVKMMVDAQMERLNNASPAVFFKPGT
jgi:GDPmannose 4,6-dehydratase